MKKIVVFCMVLVFGFILASCTKGTKDDVTFERKIASGYEFNLVINEEGNLYGFGDDMNKVIDNITDSSSYTNPILLNPYFDLNDKETFISVHAGEAHAFAVTSNDRIFVFGQAWAGQAGVNHSNQVIGTPLDITSSIGLDDDEKIKEWAQGDYHTILLTTKNRVLGWGNNTNSDLGTHRHDLQSSLGTYVLAALDMTPLFNLEENETIISVGENFALTSMNRVFGWGYEVSIFDESRLITDLTDTLTLNSSEVVLEMVRDSSIIKTNQDRYLKHALYFGFPTNTNQHHWIEINNSPAIDIQFIIYGKDENSIIIDQDHKVWLHGINEFANLGIGHTSRVLLFDDDSPAFSSYFEFEWDIDWLKNEYVIDIDMSLKNTILITNKNRIFIMGDNTKGQIGDGTTTIALTPKLLVIED